MQERMSQLTSRLKQQIEKNLLGEVFTQTITRVDYKKKVQKCLFSLPHPHPAARAPSPNKVNSIKNFLKPSLLGFTHFIAIDCVFYQASGGLKEINKKDGSPISNLIAWSYRQFLQQLRQLGQQSQRQDMRSNSTVLFLPIFRGDFECSNWCNRRHRPA